jgi:PAS domain S-box-containing protein
MSQAPGSSAIGRRGAARAAVRAVVLVALYFATGRLGLSFARIHGSVSLVWPPSGIALAALLLLGLRYWPAILAGAFLVNVTTSGAIGSSIGIAIGNTLEAVAGAALVQRFAGGTRAFDQARDVFKFAFLAGMVSTTIAATLGVASLVLWHQARWAAFGDLWLNWWVGDLGGDLMIAPFLILWRINPRPGWSRVRMLELGLVLASVILMGLVVFGDFMGFERHRARLTFLCIPPLLWAAFRFGPRKAATMSAIVFAMAAYATGRGYGAFSRVAADESAILLVLFICVASVTVLVVAAQVSERRRVEASVRAAHEELGLRHERQSSDLSRAVEELGFQVRARHRAERYAEAIVETVREPLLVLDRGFGIQAANAAFSRMFRIPREKAENRSIFELGEREWDIPEVRDVLEEVLRTGAAVEGREVVQAFPGVGTRTLMLSAFRLAGETAKGPLILLVMEDVTENRRATEELKINEERFRAVVETAVDGIVSANRSGEIIFLNPAAERIFGLSEAEALGSSLARLVHERHRQDADPGVLSFLADGRSSAAGGLLEMSGRRKDGSEFPLELAVTSWSIGGERYFTAIVRDITERKAAERELQHLSGRLLQLRDEEQRRIARELHDSTAQKFSALALNLAVLERAASSLAPQQRDALEESLELANECSSELRDISSLLHPPLLDEVGLETAIRSYVDSFARRTRIRVSLRFAPRLARLSQEVETTVFRIVQECLTNVLRHADSPAVVVEIDEGEEEVRVEVSDQGRGMPENAGRAGGGAGVGIQAMRGRVRQLDGTFEIGPVEGGGTRVTATIPVPRESA